LSLDLKNSLLRQITEHLDGELMALRTVAAAAHDAATHAENRPENKYDTRGLEASYLAGAQEARASQLQATSELIKSITPRPFLNEDAVGLTALVKLSTEDVATWYFILQVAGGYTLHSDHDSLIGTIMSITPQTPLGRAIIGKRVGDEITLRTNKGEKHYELSQLL